MEVHSTRNDPEFVSHYFQSSRLHFIGTWRGRFLEFLESENITLPSKSPVGVRGQRRIVMHIDMDSFFASVAVASNPELSGKPVAVTHGSHHGEIATANYIARSYGIHSGMFVSVAKDCCPSLITTPYDFDEYEKVSFVLYKTLFSKTSYVEAVSCDEAYLEFFQDESQDYHEFLNIGEEIREEIFNSTKCTASVGVGVGSNKLLARLATKFAKPNGIHLLDDSMVEEVMKEMDISSLPGIGWVMNRKLNDCGVCTCGDLQDWDISRLQEMFGKKTGEQLFDHCRGIDNRSLQFTYKRKSVAAEISWAVRFDDKEQVFLFLNKLSKEISTRLAECGVVGQTFSLKVKKRQLNAPPPGKFMGCGRCDTMSRSATLNEHTLDINVITSTVSKLFQGLNVPVDEVRGMGIQVTRLQPLRENRSGIKRCPGKLPALWKSSEKKRKISEESAWKNECRLFGVENRLSFDKLRDELNRYFPSDEKERCLYVELISSWMETAPVDHIQLLLLQLKRILGKNRLFDELCRVSQMIIKKRMGYELNL